MSNKHRPDLFTHTVNTMDYGVTPEQLSDALAELLQAVRDTGKAGHVSLKLTVKPESVANGQVSITPDIKLNAPQQPQGKSMMFMTPEGNLTREDPRQRSLKFESVDGAKTQITATPSTTTEMIQA